MAICIFAGTFNPIHEAHLKVAEYALEHYGFEKIIFIPAFIPPHKEISSDLAKHRFEMVKIATAYEPRFEVSDIEYKLGADGKKILFFKYSKKNKRIISH